MLEKRAVVSSPKEKLAYDKAVRKAEELSKEKEKGIGKKKEGQR